MYIYIYIFFINIYSWYYSIFLSPNYAFYFSPCWSYVALKYPGSKNVIRQPPHNWNATKCSSKNFPYTKYTSPCMENCQNYIAMYSLLFFNRREKVWKCRKTRVQICLKVFYFSWSSPRNWRSPMYCNLVLTIFHTLWSYILCMENYRNCILMHSCLPIVGRLSLNVYKFHGTRLQERNLYGLHRTSAKESCVKIELSKTKWFSEKEYGTNPSNLAINNLKINTFTYRHPKTICWRIKRNESRH